MINFQDENEKIKEVLLEWIKLQPAYKDKYNNFLSSSFVEMFLDLFINIYKSFNERLELIINNLFPSTVSDENMAYKLLSKAGIEIDSAKPSEVDITLYFDKDVDEETILTLPNLFVISGKSLDNDNINFELITKNERNDFNYKEVNNYQFLISPSNLQLKTSLKKINDEMYYYPVKLKFYNGETKFIEFATIGLEGEEFEFELEENVDFDSIKLYKIVNNEFIAMKKTNNIISEDYNDIIYSNNNVIPYTVFRESKKNIKLKFGISYYCFNKVPKKDEKYIMFYRIVDGYKSNIITNSIDFEQNFILNNKRITIKFVNENNAIGGKDLQNIFNLVDILKKQKVISYSNNIKIKQEEDYLFLLKNLNIVDKSISFGMKQYPLGEIEGEDRKIKNFDVYTYIIPNKNYEIAKNIEELEDTIRLDLYKNIYTNKKLIVKKLKLNGDDDESLYCKLNFLINKFIAYDIENNKFKIFITKKIIYRNKNYANNFNELKNFVFNYLNNNEIIYDSMYEIICHKDEYYIKFNNNASVIENEEIYINLETNSNEEIQFNELKQFYQIDENNLDLILTVNNNVIKKYINNNNIFYYIKFTSNPVNELNYDNISSEIEIDNINSYVFYDINNNITKIIIKPTYPNYDLIKNKNYYLHYLKVKETDNINTIRNRNNDEYNIVSYLKDLNILAIDNYIKEPIITYFTIELEINYKRNIYYDNYDIYNIVKNYLYTKFSLKNRNFGQNVYLSEILADIMKLDKNIIFVKPKYFGYSFYYKDRNEYFANREEEYLKANPNEIIIIDFIRYENNLPISGAILNLKSYIAL